MIRGWDPSNIIEDMLISSNKIQLQLILMLLWAITANSIPAQTIIRNFSGLTYNDLLPFSGAITPPDTMGAAGTNHFVEFINGGFAIYNKAGVRQSLVSDTTFWLNAGISSTTIAAGLTDTRIIYDTVSGRWFASELTLDTVGNKILVGRSDTSDPAGPWQAVSFVGSSSFADYDTLGVDSTGVYVGVNIFNSSGSLTGVSLFSIPKADLIVSTPTLSRMTKFQNKAANTYGFTLQGVCNPDAGPGHGVMIAVDNAAYNYIDRTTINGSGAAGASLSTRVRISNTYDSSPNPATPPSLQTVDALDDRFSGAVKQIGKYIFMANTILQGSKDAVHWLVLNETNNAVLGEGLISDPNYDFFQPSIAASHKGKILLAFNRCGTTSPAGNISIYAATGTFTNSTITMGSPFLLLQGNTSNFNISGDSPPYRWGDFSATMLDPNDDDLLWTIQEIPVSSTAWGTQITLISMATNRPTLAINGTGGSITLSWPLSTDPAYLLQVTTNLASATAWANVVTVPTISVNQNIITLTPTNGMTYYRLAK
jgi:hypothetical protein